MRTVRARRVIGALFAVVLLVGGVAVQPASASHSRWNGYSFPQNIGFLWMSSWKSYSGQLWLEHNWIGCNGWEHDRTADVRFNTVLSTDNQSSMGRWVDGIYMTDQGCSGVLRSDGAYFTYSSTLMDLGVGWDQNRAHFDQGGGVYIGGRVRRQQADSAFCAANGVSYPCGGRSFAQINWNKWVGNDGGISGDPYRRRELLHELGHAHGLIDCPSSYYGMMMNGSCGWDEGITGFNADDRASVSGIYP